MLCFTIALAAEILVPIAIVKEGLLIRLFVAWDLFPILPDKIW